MKKLTISITLLALVLTSANAVRAQVLTGILVKSPQFLETDILQYSQTNYGFTTARASAMGSAFTSLGGDLASIGINPAGLGMYNRSVFSFTPSLTVSSTPTGAGFNNYDRTFTRFAPNNIGMVFNLARGRSGLMSLNFGISYNKVADFNYRGVINANDTGSSLYNIHALQLNGLHSNWQGIPQGSLDSRPFDDTDIYTDEWGAVLGYMGGALVPANNGMSNPLYSLSTISANTDINKRLVYDSRGSIGEYNFALGMNIEDVFYLGATMGLQDIFHQTDLNYYEEYPYNSVSGDPNLFLQQMRYNQYIRSSGSSVNFKVGAIVRPVAGLRLGIAYHSPSFVNLEKSYNAVMNTYFFGNNPGSSNATPQTYYDYYFNTPSRLLAGISYTFGQYAVLSFDYERVWYNGMRLTNESYDITSDYNAVISDSFRPADNFRAGLEVKPMPNFAVRAGYAYYSSPLRNAADGTEFIQSRFIQTTSHNISAGLGFWLTPLTTLDISYIYSLNNYAPLDLFYYEGQGRIADGDGNEEYLNYGPNGDKAAITPGEIRNIRHNRHTIAMTFNFMF